MTGGNLRLQILGPLRVWRDGDELDPGPRQQAYLLAVMLARSGKPTSMNELVDLVWADHVPVSAANILQKYIGALRRLLEPTVAARATGSFLRRHGSGYLFAAGSGTLDVALFRELVGAARAGVAEERPDAALDSYVRALGLWHGPAGDGLAHGPAGMSIFAALDAEFLDVCLAAAELAISRGQPGRVLPALHLAARMAPLNEAVHASLALTLAAAGQQAHALALLRTVHARLAEELGVDPGPALVDAFRRVLGSKPDAEPPAPVAEPVPSGLLVGRVAELAILRRTAGSALTGGRGLGLVEGEPGVGKTSLLEEVAAEAGRDGALVVWGRCLEGDVAPSMWPWVQAVGTILDALPPAARDRWQAGELGRRLGPSDPPVAPTRNDGGSQFRLFEQAVSLVGQVSGQRPVVLLVDDLQWADTASLGLFSHLAARLPGGTAMFGALRSCAPPPGPALARMLAAACRQPFHRRIRLDPLGSSEVAELVRRETGQDPDPLVARQIYARTGGNPLFVRELARLSDLTSARSAVPSTVRDIVRDRTSTLDDATRRLVEIAALMGHDIDARLLASAADLGPSQCLAHLAALESLGLVEVVSGPLGHWRFVHDLVRESVALSTTRSDASRFHLSIAAVLAGSQEPVERHAGALSHHLCSAGPLAEPKQAVEALIVAARIAARRSAYETAHKHLDTATRLARGAGLLGLELTALTELTAVSGINAGFVGATMDHLDRAEELARSLGQEPATAAATAGDVAWALRAAETAINTDPDLSFAFSGIYPRLARHWATAMSGGDPATSAVETERIIESTLVDPPRSNLATWYALLAEIQLRAGDPYAAMKALDKAETVIDTYGERYAEGLVLLIRAEALRAGGDLRSAVRAARRAVALSRERGAHLFASRAYGLLGELPG